MSFNGWTVVFEIVNFLVLAWILQRLLYRPLHDALDRRRQAIEEAQAAAELAQHDAESARQKLETELALTQQLRQAVLRDAGHQAQLERERVLAEAAREAEHRKTLAEEAIERERQEAIQSLHHDLVQEAARLAARLVGDVSGADLDTRLVSRLLDTLRTLPAMERESLRRGSPTSKPVTLEAPHEISPAVVEQVREVVSELLGREVPIQAKIVPALVSGARLRLDGHVWDASLSGQLEEIGNGNARV